MSVVFEGKGSTLPSGKPDKRILTPDGKIRSFQDLGVSTKTVIAVTNLRIDLDVFFRYVPLVDFTPQEKRRGRKKRINIEIPVHILPFGSVIMVQRRRDFRGTVLKTKSRKNNTYFLHSVTIVMSLHNNKFVNVKVSANGKFQITGCKENHHYEDTILALYQNLVRIQEWTGETCYSIIQDEPSQTSTNVKAVFNTVMQNVDFNIGFPINRQRLDSFINQNTEYCSIFEGSINTEVNIKIPVRESSDTDLHQIRFDLVDQKIIHEKVPYAFYCDLLKEKERKKETRKERAHSVLLFNSGSLIMSSRGPDMERAYYEFINLLLTHRKVFEDTSHIH